MPRCHADAAYAGMLRRHVYADIDFRYFRRRYAAPPFRRCRRYLLFCLFCCRAMAAYAMPMICRAMRAARCYMMPYMQRRCLATAFCRA